MSTTSIPATRTPDASPSTEQGTRSTAPLTFRRITLMRGGYLVMGAGLAATKWPALLNRSEPWPLYEGVSTYMLVAMGLLALVGLRYPVKMLPILLFESTWKVMWLAAIALPLWIRGDMDPDTSKVAYATVWVVIVLAVVPWRYVIDQYVRARGDRWTRHVPPMTNEFSDRTLSVQRESCSG